jgi:MFS family permease
LPFGLALSCAAFCGFTALAYEIVWYRLLAFAAADTARVFTSLLGSYLLGLALGSRFVERYSERGQKREAAVHMLCELMFISAILSFAVGPAFVLTTKFLSPFSTSSGPAYVPILLSICAGAFFFGAIFPLIAHLSVNPSRRAGAALSFLYAANIIGSTLGSFVVGFILLDHLSLFSISLLLLSGGVLSAAVVLAASGTATRRVTPRAVFGVAAACFIVIGSRPMLGTIYDRLLFKNQYPKVHFQQVVEGRSGTIGVTPNGAVYGGGVYDGRFNVDLMHDVNMSIRPYALSAVHPAPRRALMIGLGSGSWAQIVANQPQLEELIVVEINPGYLKLIPQHRAVASLLGTQRC